MKDTLLADFISAFLAESRLAFSVELDEDLYIKAASRGFSFGTGRGAPDLSGAHFPALLVNGHRFVASLSALAESSFVPLVVTFRPPFPKPRTAHGLIAALPDGYRLILERDIGALTSEESLAAENYRREATIHKDLYATRDELSQLRRELSFALDRLRALEGLRAMQKLIAPLIGRVADDAMGISSLALIVSTRLGGEDSANDELLTKLEEKGAALHESAKRLGRGLS